MSIGVALGASVALLLANAFFVGAEFALVAARRSQVEPYAEQGSARARRTLAAMEGLSLMMAGAQLGITVCSVLLGAVAEPALAHLLEGPFAVVGLPERLVHPAAFSLALLIVVFLHVVVGEMVPKNLALAAPERSALLLGPALATLMRAVRPLVGALNWAANRVLRALGVEPRDEVASVFTHAEVSGLVAESRREGLLGDPEHELLQGALRLEVQPVRSVLISLDDVVALPPGATAADVERLVARSGFSRFPVRTRAGELDGYVHVKDVLETEPSRRRAPVDGAVRPLVAVGADDPLDDALAILLRGGEHLARVDDEAGRTVGLVALEDMLEELVGELRGGGSAGPTTQGLTPDRRR